MLHDGILHCQWCNTPHFLEDMTMREYYDRLMLTCRFCKVVLDIAHDKNRIDECRKYLEDPIFHDRFGKLAAKKAELRQRARERDGENGNKKEK